MRSEQEARPDRRQLRRAETIAEIISIAIEVMREDGVGGLSLGEVARRIGIRPPSLYVYFDSKNALYDAVFALGWRSAQAEMETLDDPDRGTELVAGLGAWAETFVRWAIEHPVQAQLMLWRPVPRYEPSSAAFEPAIACLDLTRLRMARLQELGLLKSSVPVAELVDAWAAMATGVISRQLANAPDEAFDNGSATSVLPSLVAMFCHYYAPTTTRKAKK